jgi:hypothetical protein
MSTATKSAFEKLLSPLSRGMRAELSKALAEMSADRKTQARYHLLARKRIQGKLTASEADELEALVQANTILGIVKGQAMLAVARQAGRPK